MKLRVKLLYSHLSSITSILVHGRLILTLCIFQPLALLPLPPLSATFLPLFSTFPPPPIWEEGRIVRLLALAFGTMEEGHQPDVWLHIHTGFMDHTATDKEAGELDSGDGLKELSCMFCLLDFSYLRFLLPLPHAHFVHILSQFRIMFRWV